MKKLAPIPLLLFFAILLMAVDCKKVLPEHISFTYNLPEQHIQVDSVPIAGTVDIMTDEQQINFDSAVNANSQGIYKPESATLSTVTLSTDSTHNLDAFKSLEVYITDSASGGILIASNNDIPDGIYSVTLTPTNANVLSYLSGNKFKLRFVITTDKPIKSAMPLNCKFGFEVRLKRQD